MTTQKQRMIKLRRKRKEKGLCSRCGNERENKNYALCQECRDYIANYKENYTPSDKEKIIIRKLKSWEIQNKKLYNELIKQKITISQLAAKIGITSRAIQRWIFQKTNPKLKNRIMVNKILGEKIYSEEK
ncbi:MAG: helix-turn-helix domain-containing protein [archaeon]